MVGRGLQRQVRGSGVVAYGCVGAAVAFIFALTFGLFDPPDSLRDVAANYAATRALATP